MDDLGGTVASDLTGSTIDSNGVVISAAEDGGDPVAIGFRNKVDTKGKHPWKAEVTDGDVLDPDVITNWYKQVYEPYFGAQAPT